MFYGFRKYHVSSFEWHKKLQDCILIYHSFRISPQNLHKINNFENIKTAYSNLHVLGVSFEQKYKISNRFDFFLNIRTCKRWCARFTFRDFDLSGKDRPGSSIEANDSLL
jgi:hypothetical protein